MYQSTFLQEVLDGLSSDPKTLPCKYFYDQRGSELFEQICQLDEYYITRTEMELLQQVRFELAELIGENAAIIEPGAGAGKKIQLLLDAIEDPELYVPLDISKDFLDHSASVIQKRFPHIKVESIAADFTDELSWPNEHQKAQGKNVVFFPGSTIGNFVPKQATHFLKSLSQLVDQDGGIVVGVDVLKDIPTLEAAYNDSQGVTAEFNKNILKRINRELDADFQIERFEHKALFNPQQSRIEMHLFSQSDQTARLGNQTINFKRGESIHTENSYKYSIDDFEKIVHDAQLKIEHTWQDKDQLFSMHYLSKA